MTHKPLEKINFGIGATQELSLRVSVATLARVLFENPRDGELMLALERKATLHEAENGRFVQVKSQPFGGAIHILDLKVMQDLIGNFHFDSTQSRAEQDFRLFIRPSAWSALRQFCVQHFSSINDPALETDPRRELVEEFADALAINLTLDQYILTPIATVIEDRPTSTDNVYARGIPTARVYRIFETSITDPALARAILTNSQGVPDKDLRKRAVDDFQHGGKGWANAMLALPLKRITDHYLSLSPEDRNATTALEMNQLDETIPAIVEGITVPKYQRL